MDRRDAARARDALLTRRLDMLVPRVMGRSGLDAWVVASREYNEDPIARTMLPATWLATARRRTLLVFRSGGEERGAISRYPVGPFPSVWDPASQPDQWEALAAYLSDVEGNIGIDVSSTFALADGLTTSEHDEITRVLGKDRLRSAESAAIGWLETRLAEEVEAMAEACRIAHGYLRRALSNEVIEPGATTTQDVAWWLIDRVRDAGLDIWFHPGVTVQRHGEESGSPADGVIDDMVRPGDLVHIDFGIVRNEYHTDQQQHAYVLRAGESSAPPSLVTGLAAGNRAQDILMDAMVPGRSGNEVLAIALGEASADGIRAIVYTHPIGLHGHAAGSTIGLWDNQDRVPGAGDYPLGIDTGWSIELAVEIEVEEWGGQPAKIMLEEDACLGDEGVAFLDGRQTELWLVR